MNAELEPTKNQTTLYKSLNDAYLRHITSDEFQNPASHLPKTYAFKLKAVEQSELDKKPHELAEQNKSLKEVIDKGDDIDSKAKIEQIKNSALKQDEMNENLVIAILLFGQK